MSGVEWPRQICPHCGNRDKFEFEVEGFVKVHYAEGDDGVIAGVNTGDLPFNSRVWCLQCGRQGRWCAWQRGVYTEDGIEVQGEKCGGDVG